MNYLVLAGIGVALIFRGFYVLSQIGKGVEKFQNQKKAANILITVGIILVSLVPATCFMGFFEKEDPEAWKTKDNTTMAYVMMQEFVKDNLKSPSTTKFEWISEPDCSVSKNGYIYTISSWVDSQNSFGAVVRTRFSGKIKQVDQDNWELVDLSFE